MLSLEIETHLKTSYDAPFSRWAQSRSQESVVDLFSLKMDSLKCATAKLLYGAHLWHAAALGLVLYYLVWTPEFEDFAPYRLLIFVMPPHDYYYYFEMSEPCASNKETA